MPPNQQIFPSSYVSPCILSWYFSLVNILSHTASIAAGSIAFLHSIINALLLSPSIPIMAPRHRRGTSCYIDGAVGPVSRALISWAGRVSIVEKMVPDPKFITIINKPNSTKSIRNMHARQQGTSYVPRAQRSRVPSPSRCCARTGPLPLLSKDGSRFEWRYIGRSSGVIQGLDQSSVLKARRALG